jgi:hypothetical protein
LYEFQLLENEYKQEELLKKDTELPTVGIVSMTGERYQIKDFASMSKGGKRGHSRKI